MRDHFLWAVGIDPERLIRSVGFIGLLAVVFAESGIMLGFFLPGDSLLFIAGFLSATTNLLPNIAIVSLGCWIAAVAGDQVGYAFGRNAGPRLFKKEDSKLFKQEYITRAEEFFEKHGSKTIMIARFVPVVRTFAPIVAGASAMNYRKFVAYNIVGGFLWAVGFTQLGYWLGNTFPSLGDRIELIVLLIIVVSVVPVGIHLLRERSKSKKAKATI
jgi:membrane-associated protein